MHMSQENESELQDIGENHAANRCDMEAGAACRPGALASWKVTEGDKIVRHKIGHNRNFAGQHKCQQIVEHGQIGRHVNTIKYQREDGQVNQSCYPPDKQVGEEALYPVCTSTSHGINDIEHAINQL